MGGRLISVAGMTAGSQPFSPWTTQFHPATLENACESGAIVKDLKRNGGASLDARDIRLIALLESDARASLAELARALSISPQSVGDRLKRLEDIGVLGFAVRLEPEKLGLTIGAYIRIQPAL